MKQDKDRAFFGHPEGLSTIFACELWERFSYFGMRALLVLFLTATYANGGFGLSELEAFTIYGIFTSLVYATPILGGIIADKVLGRQKCIYIGGLTMSAGQFLLMASAMPDNMSGSGQTLLFAGLGVLILGNGFFKPNMSAMVGEMYDNSDSRKDGGFTIFYMGINIGAFMAPLIVGALGEKVAWHYGFMSAGIGMLLGTIWFLLRSHTLGRIGMPPRSHSNRVGLVAKDWLEVAAYTAVTVVLVFTVITGWQAISKNLGSIIINTLAIVVAVYVFTIIIKGTKGKNEWSRIGVIAVLALFNILFCAGYEQAGTTLNLFARDNTQRIFMGMEIPASWFQSINAIFIIIFAPLFSLLWLKLDRKKLNPNTPMKFAGGMMLLCFGFVVMALANTISTSNADGSVRLVSPLWLVFVYLFHTFGELCLMPIGLSMVTKLSPAKIVSTMMGLWMASFAAGNLVASQMKAISIKVENALQTDIHVFWLIAIQSGIAAIILAMLSPWLKRMMKGIK